MMNDQACAHLHVEWHTLQNLDGTTFGWWQCDDCETKFVPKGRVEQLEQCLVGLRKVRVSEAELLAQLEAELETFQKHEGFVYIFPRWLRKYIFPPGK